jgi:serine/threonine-protein kinase
MYKTGDIVCDYTITGLLAQGGFSQIYKADAPDGTQVILKFPEVSLLGDLATYERFRREVSIGQTLSHPAIPKAITFQESGECVFLVMEYIEGVPLRTYISDHAPLPLAEALSFAVQLAEAIEYLHANGVYHRDLKPENIIVGPDGRIHILDFGNALLEGSRRVTWRWASNTFGTPDYMAPEQIQGKRGDSRTDVYALGMIVYEMLTGTLPFQGDNALSVMNQHLTANPIPPRRLQPSIPPGVDAAVLKSIRRDTEERYQSVSAFRYDLQHFKNLDVSQFRLEPEPSAATGVILTNRQIWVRSLLIFFGFLAFVAFIVLVVNLLHQR